MVITRKSHVADAILLEFTGNVIEYLPADLQKFKAFDPDLDEKKHNLLKTSYESALTFGTDRSQLGVLKGLTEKLSGEFTTCINIFRDVRYFAIKKFADRPAILKEFGLDSYKKARKTQAEMVLFMYEVSNAAEKYKNELIAVGLKKTTLAAIKPAAEALEKSNVGQETGKKGRAVKTEDRIELMNRIYDILLEFSDAAKLIFKADPLSRSKYILPYSSEVKKVKAAAQKV